VSRSEWYIFWQSPAGYGPLLRNVARWKLALIVAAIVLVIETAGCTSPTPINAGTAYDLTWEKLPDGSQLARKSSTSGDFAMIERCWPRLDGGFRCLQAGISSGIGSMHQIARTDEKALPTLSFGIVTTENGYSCGTLSISGPLEVISRGGKDLETNRLESLDDRWSQAHVTKDMKDNHVGGTGWFPCVEVLRKILNGSLETLGTTSVNKTMLGT